VKVFSLVSFQLATVAMLIHKMSLSRTVSGARWEIPQCLQVEKLISATRSGRYGHRDATLILVAYRHGLRASEIADLEWSQVEFGRSGTLHVRRAKNGKPSAHPIPLTRCGRCASCSGIRVIRTSFNGGSAFVFATERGGPFAPDAINRLVKRIGARARFAFPIHAHMLRHACGYALANAGHDTRRIQDWLGHRSIQHTTRYMQLSAAPFKDSWR